MREREMKQAAHLVAGSKSSRHAGRFAGACGVAAAVVALGAGSAAAATAPEAHAAGVIQAKFSLAQTAKTPMYNTITKFDNLVSKYTNGKIKITLYPNSVLGTQ